MNPIQGLNIPQDYPTDTSVAINCASYLIDMVRGASPFEKDWAGKALYYLLGYVLNLVLGDPAIQVIGLDQEQAAKLSQMVPVQAGVPLTLQIWIDLLKKLFNEYLDKILTIG